MSQDPRRKIPSVHELISPALKEQFGSARATMVARRLLADVRLTASVNEVPCLTTLQARLAEELSRRLVPVINATGVILHTNLGRAPWSSQALDAVASTAAGYCSVEMNLHWGRRGHRGSGAAERLCALTSAPAAMVVNNGAAAIMLALAGLARGKKVLVSRGELVEIGGGFRIPDVLAESGATLVEVGTTNRTHVRDYEQALSENVAAILRVHHSNFRQIGFVSQPSLDALAQLGVPLIVDQGSGALVPTPGETSVQEALTAGAALVTFSGDKLLGGPQCGVIVGQESYIQRLRHHPLMRALRLDKAILAALEATLDDWLCGRAVPIQRMKQAAIEDLRRAVEAWRAQLPADVQAEIVDVEGTLGGGSTPGRFWPSVALAISQPAPEALLAALLRSTPAVVGRVQEGKLLLDARTVVPLGQQHMLQQSLMQALERINR